MGEWGFVKHAACVFCGLVLCSFGAPLLAEEEPIDHTHPGYIPDPHDYWTDTPFDPGKVAPNRTPQAGVDARATRQNRAKAKLGVEEPKQVLFGDMHVHSTYSVDAFRFSLPLFHGSRGAFPPADACDYARYVSQLDFYWITDHAEGYTPQHWKDSVEAIRQCNAVSGDPDNPDQDPDLVPIRIT